MLIYFYFFIGFKITAKSIIVEVTVVLKGFALECHGLYFRVREFGLGRNLINGGVRGGISI